jgi:hypothetical protein
MISHTYKKKNIDMVLRETNHKPNCKTQNYKTFRSNLEENLDSFYYSGHF